MHALQARVPEQLDKLNTIIKIYSDAHVGLISKWLVQSTDRADVPISEPEEWQYTHKHTRTDKRVHNPFLISTSHYLSLSDTSAYSLSLERRLTHTHMHKHTLLPLGTLPLAFTAREGEKKC